MTPPRYSDGPAGRLLTAFDRLVIALVRVAEMVTLAITLFITLSMISGVFFRFALNTSIVWTEEVSSLMLSVMMFVVIGIGLHERVHIGVGLLFDRLSPRGQVALDIVLHLVAGCFFLIICVTGAQVAQVGMSMQLATVELPRGLFQSAAPIGSGFALLVCLNNILKVAFGGDRPVMQGVD